MEHNDFHFRWWHWLLIVAVIFLVMGVAFTWINNRANKNSDQSYTRGIEQTIEHPIHATENAINNIRN